jgi:1-deoxy-D-xylulose-5-phosphate synthase
MFLESIGDPSDLKKLDIKQLPALCDELRKELIQTVEQNGGHLASNLGVVELTVALHYVFDIRDKIIWDVGHQSYVHKLLTGRFKDFSTLRKKDGLSGFPDITESQYDAFGTGHASTAISAGLGLAKARDIKHDDFSVVCVVGDGALTGGLSYEGLNSIDGTNMLIVFNDNDMSIGKNVGSATKNLSRVRVRKGYLKFKSGLEKTVGKIPLIGKPIVKFLKSIKRAVKLSCLRNIYFENFDIKYVGPVKGHDVKELVSYLKSIKENVKKPTVLHVITKKGFGLPEAEENPALYHSLACKTDNSQINMSEIVGRELLNLGEDERVVAVSAAMTQGVGLKDFAEKYPERFFDVGIAESHAVTFCAGLAAGGFKPFFAVYSTFLQRAYDQILHDVAVQKLNVTMLIDHAGFVGEDGQTHQGLFDIAALLPVPGMTLLAPADDVELKQMLAFAYLYGEPLAIRYPAKICRSFGAEFRFGVWRRMNEISSDIALLAVGGRCLDAALDAAEILASQSIAAEVYNCSTLKPFDEDCLKALESKRLVITLEEGVKKGGFGEAVAARLRKPVCIGLGVDDKFVRHATVEQQLEENGLTADNIAGIVKSNLF